MANMNMNLALHLPGKRIAEVCQFHRVIVITQIYNGVS